MQRAVLLDLLELLEGRRPDEAHPALRQHRLEQVGQVHRPAAGGAGPDHRVQLVDEEDRLRAPLERRDEGLEALLEVAAKARAGQQRPGVEREDLGAAQRLGGVVAGQALRETLDERGLADAGLAHEDGVVLAAAAEHLERAGDLGQAADERVELAGARPLREVDREGRERVGGRPGRLPRAVVPRLVVPRLRLGAGDLGDPVRDVVEDVEAGDALGVQGLRRVGLRLRQQRGDDIPHARLLATRAGQVQNRLLEHAPEGDRLHRLGLGVLREPLDRALEVPGQVGAQPLEVGAAGAQDLLA